MPFLSRRIDPLREIEALEKRLQAVHNLKGTVDTPGWGQIVKIFKEEIATFTQMIFDMAGEPTKNAEKIKIAHQMARSLSGIIGTIDGRVRSGAQIEHQITELAESARTTEDVL